jgi:drug/metabolite transporter (DMT)-like permease
MSNAASQKSHRLGTFYALGAAMVMATQAPFSALAAKRLSPVNYVCVVQIALLLAVPLLVSPVTARHDFIALLKNFSNFGRLSVLLVLGVAGLMLYFMGLSNANPIIIEAILNLSPFWAAMVARVISGKAAPVSAIIFFGCFLTAFMGAMLVAWSQMKGDGKFSVSDLVGSVRQSSWIYAIPIPIIFALSGTLLSKWFAKYDESATIAVNFLMSSFILIPTTLVISIYRGQASANYQQLPAIILLVIGTFLATAPGRVLYQKSLRTTGNDNGFVTMFFLLIPALTSLISVPLSWYITELGFVAGPAFFTGLVITGLPLLVFSIASWGR